MGMKDLANKTVGGQTQREALKRLRAEVSVANGLLLRAWVQLEHKEYADDHPLIVQIKKHLKAKSIKECLDRQGESAA